jgi:hypothetical protein
MRTVATLGTLEASALQWRLRSLTLAGIEVLILSHGVQRSITFEDVSIEGWQLPHQLQLDGSCVEHFVRRHESPAFACEDGG